MRLLPPGTGPGGCAVKARLNVELPSRTPSTIDAGQALGNGTIESIAPPAKDRPSDDMPSEEPDYGLLRFEADEQRRWPVREARRILREVISEERRAKRQEALDARTPPPRWLRRREDRERR
jgi:hypothetical protein